MAAITARRLFWVTLPAFLAYVVHRGAHRANDFKYPYNVARHVWKTGELAVAAQPRYPVTFHVLLSPLASRSIGIAAAVWAVLSVAAIIALPRVMASLTGIPRRRQVLAWLPVIPCFIDAVVLGQSDPINMLFVSLGLLGVSTGWEIAGTGLVGLAAMIKFLPIIFWTTIIARRPSWRVLAGIGLSILFGLGLVTAAVGWKPGIAGFQLQWTLIQDREKPWHLVARQSDLRPNNESFPIVLARTFGDLGSQAKPPSISLAHLPLNLIWTCWGIVLVALAMGWLASIRPASTLPPRAGWLGMFALTAIIMLAATPICWHHYFLWTLPATLFLSHRRRFLRIYTVLAILGTIFQTARGFGCHMFLALALFILVAHDLRKFARNPSSYPDYEAA